MKSPALLFWQVFVTTLVRIRKYRTANFAVISALAGIQKNQRLAGSPPARG